MKYYDKLIFELSKEGRKGYTLPENRLKEYTLASLPEGLKRQQAPELPEVSEFDVVRHYTNISNKNFGVDTGFYPLGSCTMKYNPKINEEMAAQPAFANLHPLQPAATAQGALEVYYNLAHALAEISGLAEFTLNPYAGAHGELTGLMVMRQYHLKRGDLKRTKVIVPDSAHGTNPASAAVCGLNVVEVKSKPDGRIDVEHLKPLLDDTIAGIMMTNPNTLGLFESDILEIAELVHACGGLLYYDGANLNAVMGVVRPGDMGFDCIHMNLHKTFATPHGGGGPGAGAVGCKDFLREYLPHSALAEEPGHIQVRSFRGNFLVVVRALAYLLTLGKEGIPEAAENAVLNANYLMAKLKGTFTPAYDRLCMHEFVLDLSGLKKETGVSALDVAKSLIDEGIHPPTMYFPLIVHEALMLEPTETESRETLDQAAEVFRQLYQLAHTDPETMRTAPHNAQIGRPDEVQAARKPILRWKPV